MLYRMGSVTQEMFYKLRAYGIWFDKVDQVDRVDDDEGRPIMKVYLSNADLTAWESFPGSRFITTSERHAVLASGNGLYAVQMLRGLFGTWLGGMAYTLREVAVRPRNRNLVVFLPSRRGVKIPETPTTHWLFRIILPDGSDYAVDFANAQFARLPKRMQFHGIMPWSDYIFHLQLAEAEIDFHKVIDEEFFPRAGIYARSQLSAAVNLHAIRKLFDVDLRDRMTPLVTRFSMILSLENCLIQRFHREKNERTMLLTGVLASPTASFLLYRRRIMDDLSLFLLAWRLVLKYGETCPDPEARETPQGFLKKMWNLMNAALRETHEMNWGIVPKRNVLKRNRGPNKAGLADTPQQSA
jgi:hypothetical protein